MRHRIRALLDRSFVNFEHTNLRHNNSVNQAMQRNKNMAEVSELLCAYTVAQGMLYIALS